MENRLPREEFEEKYTLWIESASKDIAFALEQLDACKRKEIISKNEQYLEEPESVYGRNGLEAAEKLVPENILLLSTDAVVFSQSIFVPMPCIFDYAVAINRRYYLGKWYSIITLNNMYLKEASYAMLKYTLEHELLQKVVYEENTRNEFRRFTPEEKRKISDDALNKAIEKSGITRDELVKENRLMQKISFISPLIPKPFAETALYMYVEKNIEELNHFAEESRNEREDNTGKKLNSDFKGWIDFSINTYRMFLSCVKKELNYVDYGYV